MKIQLVKFRLIIFLFFLAIACSPPYKPDYDVGFGEIIFKDSCKNQQVYLANIVNLQAYKSGKVISDTLTILGIKYNHVVRLDSIKSSFLINRKLHDKISINFLRGPRLLLPNCSLLQEASVETINVISAESTNY